MNINKLEVTQESGQYLYVLCPYHDETAASLYINKIEHNGKPKGYYYCFGCKKTGIISEADVDKLSKKKGYKTKSVPQEELFRQTIVNLSGVLDKDYPGDLIYKGSSAQYLIGWDGLRWTAPMWNEKRRIIGLQTRTRKGTKWNIPGSKLGLFLPVESVPITDTIYICEGLTDTLVATHCTGMTSIGLPSANSGHEMVRDYFKKIDFKGDIVIVGDKDEAGRKSVRKLCSLLNEFSGWVRWPMSFKDLREYYETRGFEKTKGWLKPY